MCKGMVCISWEHVPAGILAVDGMQVGMPAIGVDITETGAFSCNKVNR